MEISPLPVMFWLVSFVQDGLAQERPQAVLSVSPHSWMTEGASVTLSCEVTDSSTGWTFNWYKAPVLDINGNVMYYVELLSDNSRGAGGSYTLSPAALHHTGVYVCRAEREEPAYQTQYSNLQPLWITGVSPPVSLIISPSRTQHFRRDSLSLSCEGQSDSTGWRVRQYTHDWIVSDCLSDWESVPGSTCIIRYLYTYNTGVYWCQSESGGSSNPVNITVHYGDVILESPVHPVTEGDPLTLHCLLQPNIPSILRAFFYKDGLVLLNQPPGEMTIRTVSQSDEGLYHCKHPERGESPSSWVSVRVKPTPELTSSLNGSVLMGNSVTLHCKLDQSAGWRFYWYKHTQNPENETNTANSSYTISSVAPSDGGQYWCRAGRGNPVYYTHYTDALWVNVTVTMNSDGDSHHLVLVGLAVGLSLVLLFILLVLLWCYKKETAHKYATAGQAGRSGTDEATDEPSDVTSAQVMKHNKSRNKDRTVPVQDSQTIYSQIQSGGGTDAGAGPSEVTYAEVEMKMKKKTKTAEKTSVGTDTVYSELRQDTHKGQSSKTHGIISVVPGCTKRLLDSRKT